MYIERCFAGYIPLLLRNSIESVGKIEEIFIANILNSKVNNTHTHTHYILDMNLTFKEFVKKYSIMD